MSSPAARALTHVRGPGAAGEPPALLEQVGRTGTALGVAAGDPQSWPACLSGPRARAGRTLDDFPADLRGPEAAALARRPGPIDAAVLGPDARVLGPHLVKYLGHILVLRGRLRETR